MDTRRDVGQVWAMVKIPLRVVVWSLAAAVLALMLWLWWLWSPPRQAELHTWNFLSRVSSQNWVAAGEMMAPDYRDAWHADREQALRGAEELGRHFFTLQIGPVAPVTIRVEGAVVFSSAQLGIYGAGTPAAGIIMDEIRALKDPFVFRWRKGGPWPWQWTLVEIEQAELAARFSGYDTGAGMP